MYRNTLRIFFALSIILVLGAFFCGCKSKISEETPQAVTPAMDHNPDWNSTGSKIVFCSNRDGNREIYVMDADGSNQIRLTNSLRMDNYPKWSPDDTKIAYNSYKDNQNDICIMNTDGTNQVNLTENSPGDWFTAWSPDSNKIVFQSNRDGNWEIYTMNADGSEQIRLTEHKDYDVIPSFSPDGTRIVFASNRDGNFEIYSMKSDGSNKIRLTDNPARDRNPLCSLDGSKIVFESNRNDNREFFIMDADGSNQTRLTDNLYGWPMSFSPDGSRIAFASNKDGQMDIFTMDIDGSNLTRLTRDPGDDWTPAWSPEGTKIVFCSNRLLMGILGDIYVMDVDGDNVQNLTNSDVIPAREIRNIEYGEHEQNVLDLWLVEADEPAPLVIFYHGGGFRSGDKRGSMPVTLLLKLIDAGINVAGVNYRLTDSAPFPAQMHDSARALQFIRYHADEYNIDPSRIGATGGSAGAGISMWLAFHDDLADPENENPILRESTRLTAIVPYNGQSSYDPRFIQKLFNTDQINSALIPFFGMSGPEDIQNPQFFPLFEKASPINFASSDDPPVYMYYRRPNEPLPPNNTGNQHIHHPKLGIVLKEKLDKLGVECIIKFSKDYPDGQPYDEYVKFFREKFGMLERTDPNSDS